MNLKKLIALTMSAGLMLCAQPVLAEEPAQQAIVDTQKLDASYTLALNAINAEEYDTTKEYLSICFAYCDPQTNPEMYADLLLKQACISVIEEKTDMALLQLDAALRIQPELADAYLVRTQVYAGAGEVDQAIENLEKYIDLTKDTSLYETVAQLQEAKGDVDAAQAAYDKYVEGAGSDVAEAGFQSGLYKMQAGNYEEAIKAFEAYKDDETYAAGAAYNIGICKMNTQDYAGAIEGFTTSAEKGGTFDGLYYNRGVCYMLSEDWANAISDFNQSAASESYVDDANFNLGVCQMQQGSYDDAIATFTALIGDGKPAATTPTIQTQTQTVTTITTQAPEATAEPEAPKAVNDAVYYYRAVCRAANNDLEGALADFTVCIDHEYELSQTYYQRAQVYAAMGDTEKQNSDLENSLKYAG